MRDGLSPHYLELVGDAALKSFWRRRALRDFLRRCGVSQTFLAGWSEEESKRDLLNRLFPLLESHDKGAAVINEMARSLAEQTSFPDLESWEDSAEKKRLATQSVEALKKYLQKRSQDVADAREREEARKRAEVLRLEKIKQEQDLAKLSQRLAELSNTTALVA